MNSNLFGLHPFILFILMCILFYSSFTSRVNRFSNAYKRGLEKHNLKK